jgi:hypothetical protein
MHANASRIAAALIAGVTLLGLVVQFAASLQQVGSLLPTLWVLLWYFTILTNVLVAVVFFAIAIYGQERLPANVIAGTTLSIVLVGVIYALLLHGLTELSGGSLVANVLLHMVTPVVAPVYWVWLTTRGQLRWRDPLVWAIYPLVYFFYALLRGEFTSKYPYPFMDVPQLGWPRTLINAGVIALGYMAAGYLMVAIDQGPRRKSSA